MTLEAIFAEVGKGQMTGQINIVRGEDRWQVSMRRPGSGSAYKVTVDRNLVKALKDCLTPEDDDLDGSHLI